MTAQTIPHVTPHYVLGEYLNLAERRARRRATFTRLPKDIAAWKRANVRLWEHINKHDCR